MSKIKMFKQVESFREDYERACDNYGTNSKQAENAFHYYEAAKFVLNAGGLFNDYFDWRNNK